MVRFETMFTFSFHKQLANHKGSYFPKLFMTGKGAVKGAVQSAVSGKGAVQGAAQGAVQGAVQSACNAKSSDAQAGYPWQKRSIQTHFHQTLQCY